LHGVVSYWLVYKTIIIKKVSKINTEMK
jgi:hypothetical protein